MPTFTFRRRPFSVIWPSVLSIASRSAAATETSSRCLSTWLSRSPSTFWNSPMAGSTESGCATHEPSKPAAASRFLSAATASSAFCAASSSVRDGITALMPPMACAPRLWQVLTSSSE